jgi:hypothetical protein
MEDFHVDKRKIQAKPFTVQYVPLARMPGMRMHDSRLRVNGGF